MGRYLADEQVVVERKRRSYFSFVPTFAMAWTEHSEEVGGPEDEHRCCTKAGPGLGKGLATEGGKKIGF